MRIGVPASLLTTESGMTTVPARVTVPQKNAMSPGLKPTVTSVVASRFTGFQYQKVRFGLIAWGRCSLLP